MSGDPITAREALVAELLGDVHKLLTGLERADRSARATAKALTDGTASYRQQLDGQVKMLRDETASIIMKTTQHAAQSVVSAQSEVLRLAAIKAMREALTADVSKRTRVDWLMAAAAGATSGTAATFAYLVLDQWFRNR